jgi:hypothetical protein
LGCFLDIFLGYLFGDLEIGIFPTQVDERIFSSFPLFTHFNLMSAFSVPYHVQPPPSRATKTQDDDYSSSSDEDNDNYDDSDDSDSDDDELEGAGGVEDTFEDPSRDYSGSTRQATFYFHKRWFETMMGLKDDEVRRLCSHSFRSLLTPYAPSPSSRPFQMLVLTSKS